MRKVMIGTPCMTGDVGCRFTNSYAETVRMGMKIGVEVYALFIPGNAMVHSARNDVVKKFLDSGFYDLVFIDSDITWNPEDFFKLLNHDVECVGATYALKQNELSFVMKTHEGKVPNLEENGLMKVLGLGMGFFRLTRTACMYLYDKSDKYHNKKEETEYSNVFEFSIVNGEQTGEDITMCLKLPEVWLDPFIILEHTGYRQHFGSPIEWLKTIQKQEV